MEEYFTINRKGEKIKMEMKARHEQRVSTKTGKEYTVIVITFANGYQKLVFLDSAEIYMLKDVK